LIAHNRQQGNDAFVEQRRSSGIRWSAFLFLKEVGMARARQKSMTGKIFDNIIFLEEVFGDQADGDIPKLPVLEMARCFDLQVPRGTRAVSRRRNKAWSLWK
jgi:hypothetical protein